VDEGLGSSQRALSWGLGKPLWCTSEDTKEEDLFELIGPGSTPGQVLVGSTGSLSAVWTQHFPEPGLPRTFFSCYNLQYPGLRSFDNVICTP